jgi:predicted RNA binding protein YcfA (HicA-like mRNA interferase family)
MMGISQDEVIRILKKHGWVDTRRGKESHKVFVNADMRKVTTVPKRKDLGKGLLSAIRRQTGIDEIG